MTISTQVSSVSYTGDGSTVAFSVPFYFAASSELTVKTNTAGTISTKTLGVDYTVTGAGTGSGTVTFTTAPSSGVEVWIDRNTPKTQTLDLTAGGNLDPDQLEQALDKLTRIAQDVARSTGAGPHATDTPLTKTDAGTAWDAASLQVKNLAPATDTTDAVTYAQLQAAQLAVGAGNVVGPASSVDGRPVLFDQTTGKLIKQGFDLAAGCSVTKSATQSIPNTTYTTVTFDTESFDTENIHSIVSNTSRLTVPSGVSWVRLSAQIGWAINNTGGRIISIYKNGNFITTGFQLYLAFSESYQSVITPYLAVTPGDYFELLVYQSSGGSLNLAAGTTFSMEIVK